MWSCTNSHFPSNVLFIHPIYGASFSLRIASYPLCFLSQSSAISTSQKNPPDRQSARRSLLINFPSHYIFIYGARIVPIYPPIEFFFLFLSRFYIARSFVFLISFNNGASSLNELIRSHARASGLTFRSRLIATPLLINARIFATDSSPSVTRAAVAAAAANDDTTILI